MSDATQSGFDKRLLLLVALQVAAGAAVLIKSTGRVHEPSLRSQSANRLNQIGKALEMYADAGDGLYPASLAALYPRYIDDATVFVNPRESTYRQKCAEFREATAGKSLPPELVGEFDYAYEPGRAAIDFTDIVAYECRLIGDGRNVLKVGGIPEWMSEDEFQQALAKQNEKNAAAAPNSSSR